MCLLLEVFLLIASHYFFLFFELNSKVACLEEHLLLKLGVSDFLWIPVACYVYLYQAMCDCHRIFNMNTCHF